MKKIILWAIVALISSNIFGQNQLSNAKNDHTAIRVENFEESIVWYKTKLGFTEIKRWSAPAYIEKDLQLAYLQLNDIIIEIAGGGNPKKRIENKKELKDLFKQDGYFHICLQVENIDTLMAELKARGISIFAGPNINKSLNRKFIHVLDNSGNDLEFVEYLDKPTSFISTLKADHLMIAVGNNFAETVKWYQDILGFELEVQWKVKGLDHLDLAYMKKNGWRIEIIGDKTSGNKVNSPKDFGEHLSSQGFSHICFATENIDQLMAELKAKGITIFAEAETYPISEKYTRRVAFIKDLNGNIIEFGGELTKVKE